MPSTMSTSFILLGEGDFTYSLDLCRFIVASASSTTASDDDDDEFGAIKQKSASDGRVSISIACTGIDTLHELRKKYKDIEFVLRNIRKSNNEHGRIRVETTILHGINAVEAECNDINDTINSACKEFDHVIFNHPHLGTENAQLHSRFLQHLFHACVKRWMKPRTGHLHLTLVNGQCARWNCIEGAMRHGLVLLRRGPFCPPPPPPITTIDSETNEKTYYSLRRHQSGRSFANRRAMQLEDGGNQNNDSETLVFGRSCDDHKIADIDLFPWEFITRGTENCVTTLDASAEASSNNHTSLFPCTYCSKSFHEHRSLKNHLLSLHPTCEEVRTWNIEKSQKRNKRRKLNNEGNCNGENPIDDVKNISMRQSDDKAALRDSDGDGIQGPPWICSLCDSQRRIAMQRKFPHKDALLAHQQAKHFGSHLNIKPDWHQNEHVKEINITDESHDSETGGDKGCSRSCPICDKKFISDNEESLHAMEFLPSNSALATATTQQFASKDILQSNRSTCTYCSRSFGGVRARLQHENFCSFRPQHEGAERYTK